MQTRRNFSGSSAAFQRPSGPRCHGGASSLLRMGLGSLPQPLLHAPRAVSERTTFLLDQPRAPRQLTLFGPRDRAR
jgi:hypothetical protein